jgi:hypothetical protein
MTIAIISFLAGFAAGFLVFRNNAIKVSTMEAKGRAILDALKGKGK